MRYRFATCVLDTDRHLLIRDGEPVKAEPQVFDLLHLLVRNAGVLVTRDQIVDEIWDGRIVSESSISARTNAARKAVGDSGKEQAIIKTVTRRGLQLVAPVSTDDRTAPDPLVAVSLSDGSLAPTVAVLPFSNLSPNPKDGFFADGIAEDITTELSRFGSLRVTSRMSSFQYRDAAHDLQRIFNELGASFVLSGSVRRSSTRIRVSVELSDTANGGQIWAERYDRPMNDVFAVQDEIAEIVASTLSGRVQKISLQRANAKKPSTLSAYEHLLKGLDLHKSGDVSKETAQKAVMYFSSAIGEDPDFARAYAWRACSFSRTWGFPASVSEFEACLLDVSKALELDPGEAEAHRIAGAVYRIMHDFEKADHHISQALILNPSDALIAIKSAEHFGFMGRAKEAHDLCIRAMQLNPIYPEWYREIQALIDYADGNYSSVVANMGKVRHPTFAGYAYRAAAEHELGQFKAAARTINDLRAAYADIPLAVYERSGHRFCFKNQVKHDRFVFALSTNGLC